MSAESDEGTQTAWERWELASFDAPGTPGSAAAARNSAPAGMPLKPSAAEEIEQLRQQARNTGQAEGYAEGRAQALKEAKRLAALAEQLDSALNAFDQQVAEDLLALALDVARQVIRQSLAVKPELLLETVREALVQMPHQHANIILHPEDASLVRTYLGEQLAHAGQRILEDPRIERGGCLIEAAGSQIDASLATRWRRVVENLGSNAEWLGSAE
jgi:flagellar assembly protein FliH